MKDAPIPQWLIQRMWQTKQERIKIKPVAIPCEDCGRIVEDRVVRSTLCQSAVHYPHYKIACKVCNKYRNPLTGKFDSTFYDVQNQFRKRKNKK